MSSSIMSVRTANGRLRYSYGGCPALRAVRDLSAVIGFWVFSDVPRCFNIKS